jgi:hypothetical protein
MPPASSDAAGWRIKAELAWDVGWAAAAAGNGSTLREVARVRFGLGTLHGDGVKCVHFCGGWGLRAPLDLQRRFGSASLAAIRGELCPVISLAAMRIEDAQPVLGFHERGFPYV